MSPISTSVGASFAATALTKLIVYFKDGNVRTFHGRHTTQKFSPVDPRALEILRLKKYAASVQAHIQLAILYDTQTGDELARFKNGAWV
jgi:hypothetical protein